MKKYFFYIFIFSLFLFPGTKVFAQAQVSGFVSEVVLNASCVPVVTVSFNVVPSTITSGNVFVVGLKQVASDGTQIYADDDFTVSSIPVNGQIVDQSFTGSTGYNVQSGLDYEVRLIENTSNQSLVAQHGFNSLAADMGTCSVGTGTGANPSNSGTGSSSSSFETEDLPIEIENPISINSIPQLIEKILELLIKIGIPLLVVMLVYSGALYILAVGNSSKISDAHKMLTYTLIGGAILLGAWALATLIRDTFISITAFILSNFV